MIVARVLLALAAIAISLASASGKTHLPLIHNDLNLIAVPIYSQVT